MFFSSTGGPEYPVNPVLDAYGLMISAMQKMREGVKSLRGRGSCHSTFHRQVRLPHLPATAKRARHTNRPQLNAPVTFTGHQYSKQVVRRLGAVRSIMYLKGGISW